MDPTSEQILRALPHIRYEIESFLASPSFDKTNESLRESVYFRRMAHCRALHDFFRTSKLDRRRDDMVSEDFGFTACDVYGTHSSEFSKEFNKHLMHLTYERLNRTLDRKPWSIEALFPPVEKHARLFVAHVLKAFHGHADEAELKSWRLLGDQRFVTLPLSQNTGNVAIYCGSLLPRG